MRPPRRVDFHDAGGAVVRRDGGRRRRRDPGDDLHELVRPVSGPTDPDLRRVRSDRHVGGAVGQAARRARDGRVWHGQRRHGRFARPRRRRRLPAHRLHGDGRDVRRGLRRGRQVVVPSLSIARAAGWPVRVDRPRVHVAERVPVAAHPEVRADADPDAAPQVHAGQGGEAALVGRVGRLPGRGRPLVPARPDRRRHARMWRRNRNRATC